MLRSKGIICTGCAACDSIYKRTSHDSQETNRGHRPEVQKQLHDMPYH